MLPLLEFIQKQFNFVFIRSYRHQAPKNTQYPFITYNIPFSTVDEDREDFFMDIDIWDKSEDLVELYSILADIENKFDNLQHLEKDKFQVSFYKTGISDIPDPDTLVKRVQIRCVVKAYILK